MRDLSSIAAHRERRQAHEEIRRILEKIPTLARGRSDLYACHRGSLEDQCRSSELAPIASQLRKIDISRFLASLFTRSTSLLISCPYLSSLPDFHAPGDRFFRHRRAATCTLANRSAFVCMCRRLLDRGEGKKLGSRYKCRLRWILIGSLETLLE